MTVHILNILSQYMLRTAWGMFFSENTAQTTNHSTNLADIAVLPRMKRKQTTTISRVCTKIMIETISMYTQYDVILSIHHRMYTQDDVILIITFMYKNHEILNKSKYI